MDAYQIANIEFEQLKCVTLQDNSYTRSLLDTASLTTQGEPDFQSDTIKQPVRRLPP